MAQVEPWDSEDETDLLRREKESLTLQRDTAISHCDELTEELHEREQDIERLQDELKGLTTRIKEAEKYELKVRRQNDTLLQLVAKLKG